MTKCISCGEDCHADFFNCKKCWKKIWKSMKKREEDLHPVDYRAPESRQDLSN